MSPSMLSSRDGAPKAEFHSAAIVEIATYLAVITFNSGKEAL